MSLQVIEAKLEAESRAFQKLQKGIVHQRHFGKDTYNEDLELMSQFDYLPKSRSHEGSRISPAVRFSTPGE